MTSRPVPFHAGARSAASLGGQALPDPATVIGTRPNELALARYRMASGASDRGKILAMVGCSAAVWQTRG